MIALIHDLPACSAERTPQHIALKYRNAECTYADLQSAVERFAYALVRLELGRHERVGVYLPKQTETVVALFGTARAGGVFVPINPVLKPAQVRYILRDCNVRVLVTSADRLEALLPIVGDCPDLRHVIVVNAVQQVSSRDIAIHAYDELIGTAQTATAHRCIDTDTAAILYTSGSTGSPKGVVLSHRNLVAGAQSVVQYLQNSSDDRLLAVLPFSFDYGLSQLTTAFAVGARVVLMDHLFPRDVVRTVVAEHITGLAAVPPLWTQLAELPWPPTALRYITNSGGAMPATTLQKLRASLSSTRVFLMYGLTEAFRSTYLPPEELDRRPGSIGKAIPNAEILVLRPDGTECGPDEPGELVHRGALVGLGYWNAPETTALRFRPAPNRMPELSLPEIAVWSGDTVRKDSDGFFYFIGRQDETIKTSGYRVSPTEIEEVVLSAEYVAEAVAVGVPHPSLGQVIVVFAVARASHTADTEALLDHCRRALPTFMVPARIEWRSALPRNANGKYDRRQLRDSLPISSAP